MSIQILDINSALSNVVKLVTVYKELSFWPKYNCLSLKKKKWNHNNSIFTAFLNFEVICTK